MKKYIFIILILPLALLLSGCPVGLDYPLGQPGKEHIDEQLIGNWHCDNTETEVIELSISKQDDFSYRVVVTERGSTYALETDSLTAWVTQLGNKTFFYLKPDNEDKFYHYMVISADETTLVTCDMALLVGGIDVVTSREALLKEVEASMQKPEFTETVLEWNRID
jgi:ABC-type amino acid transport substrate-binding protein